MNIFKVIGWTDDPDEKYPSIDGSVAVDRAIMTEVREKGYRFGGDAHQERRGCCPVFNNGAKVCCSMRGWGVIMVEALKRYCPNFHGYGGGHEGRGEHRAILRRAFAAKGGCVFSVIPYI